MIYSAINQAFTFIKEQIFEQESGEFMITINDDFRELYAVFFHADLEWEEDETKVCTISNLRMSDGNINLTYRFIDQMPIMQLLSELIRLKSKNPYIWVELFEEIDGPFEPITEFHQE